MNVRAIVNFKDRNGVYHAKGDEWIISCKRCALKLKQAGKIEILR